MKEPVVETIVEAVKVTLAQIIDIVADDLEFESEKPLAFYEVDQVQQNMDFGTHRMALLECHALGRRQREEEIPVTLGKTREAPH